MKDLFQKLHNQNISGKFFKIAVMKFTYGELYFINEFKRKNASVNGLTMTPVSTYICKSSAMVLIESGSSKTAAAVSLYRLKLRRMDNDNIKTCVTKGKG